MKAIKLGFVFGAAILASVGLGNAQQVYKATGTGVSPPFNFIAPNETTQQGLNVDLVNAIAADAGFSIRYVEPIVLGNLMAALNAGNFDIPATALSWGQDDAAGIAFSNRYALTGEGVWVLKTDNTPYKSLDDLKGQAVSAVRGSAHAEVLQARASTFTAVKTYETSADLARAVISGEIKAALTAGSIAAYRLKQGDYPQLKLPPTWQIAMPTLSTIGVRKADTELLAKINTSLTKLIANGTVKTIFAKYGIDWVKPPPAL